MSWGALPGWVYEMDSWKREAKMLGGFEEEIEAGWFRDEPPHLAWMDRHWKWTKPVHKQYQTVSLGVRIFDPSNPKRVYHDSVPVGITLND